MRVIRGFDGVAPLCRAVATVGSYDGVHRGHRELLVEVVRRARECGGESVVVTFEPHPRLVLGQGRVEILTTLEEKCLLLEEIGIDCLVVIPFDRDFAKLSHETFIDDYIVGKLHIEQLVVGYNHRFGHENRGDYNFLAQHSVLKVVEMEQYCYEGDKVSSTQVRKTMAEGDMVQVQRLLGHPYIIKGVADKEGRIVVSEHKLMPADGEYKAVVGGTPSTVEIVGGVVCQREYFSQEIVVEL